MKRILLLFTLMLSIIPSLSFGASDNVYVIEISGEVNPGMLNYVRENIEDANNKNADLILFEVDTLGGRIDSAEKISQEILKSKVKTASYVNTKAESAGVLLSISANSLYMAPASTIGSAEPIPNTEKTLSYWKSLLETTAEKRGSYPKLVAAMADSSIEIDNLVGKDKLLNLTTNKAKELNCDVFIEDNPQNSLEIAESGIKVLLMDTNYNKTLSHKNIIRVQNWNDIKLHIDKMSKQ